jgi:hypothetical protein
MITVRVENVGVGESGHEMALFSEQPGHKGATAWIANHRCQTDEGVRPHQTRFNKGFALATSPTLTSWAGVGIWFVVFLRLVVDDCLLKVARAIIARP